MLSKTEVYNTCLELVTDKHAEYKKALKEITEEAKTDSKSSAGDKHETSRAMMQMEQEKIINQLEKTIEQKNQLEKINLDIDSDKVITGSLILTDKGYFFLAVALGKINIADTPVFVLSPTSPLGSKLLGMKRRDAVVMNDTSYRIEDFC